MIDDRTIEAVHRELDGLNTEEESANLRSRMTQDPPVREFYDELVSLRSILRGVKPVEPPRYLKNAIINSIPFRKAAVQNSRFSISPFNQEGFMNNKVLKFGLVAVATVGLVYFAFLYPWPGNDQVQGTIGGVKKYNAGQLTDKDVKLAGTQVPVDRISVITDRINTMEGRLAPEARTAIQEARIQYAENRLGIVSDSRTAPATIEARLAAVEAAALSKSAGLPADQRIANLEAMTSLPADQRTAPAGADQRTAPAGTDQRTAPAGTDQRTAPAGTDQRTAPVGADQRTAPAGTDQRSSSTLEQRLNTVENRLGINQDSRSAGLTIEARLNQAEGAALQRVAGLPAEQRIQNLESRVATTVEARQALLEARLSNIESRINVPSDSRTSLESRINNAESRLASPEQRQQ